MYFPVPVSLPGSSPRSWGTRDHAKRSRAPCRFIPTLVGNTHVDHLFLMPDAVHPHARGEHTCTFRSGQKSAGSSPRSWGTRRIYALLSMIPRFIPTLVGNTVLLPTVMPRISVHPHARGEHLKVVCKSPKSAGSSPRSWGTRLGQWFNSTAWRFIPTLVGNTCRANQ